MCVCVCVCVYMSVRIVIICVWDALFFKIFGGRVAQKLKERIIHEKDIVNFFPDKFHTIFRKGWPKISYI